MAAYMLRDFEFTDKKTGDTDVIRAFSLEEADRKIANRTGKDPNLDFSLSIKHIPPKKDEDTEDQPQGLAAI